MHTSSDQKTEKISMIQQSKKLPMAAFPIGYKSDKKTDFMVAVLLGLSFYLAMKNKVAA